MAKMIDIYIYKTLLIEILYNNNINLTIILCIISYLYRLTILYSRKKSIHFLTIIYNIK